MNEELIDSLMWKAGAKFEMMNWVHYDDFDYRKFAKLVIEECDKAASAEIERVREENERLVNNARSDAKLLAAYHKWCQMHNCAPSSRDLSTARTALEEDHP